MALFGTTFDRATRLRVVDVLVMLLAVSLPWSTSATAILSVLFFVALLPTLERDDRTILLTPAGGLPLLLLLLGIAGMAWADVSLLERWKGLDSFVKLLFVPLLLMHFRRSERGLQVFAAYALSCIGLLIVSYAIVLLHVNMTTDFGVPAKNAPTQSGEFAACIAGFAYLAYEWIVARKWVHALGAIALMLAMFADMVFVATGRTALVMVVALLFLFALLHLTKRGVLLLAASVAAVVALAWVASPYFRARTEQVWTDLRAYEKSDARNSSGERMEFAKRSLDFIREAPLIGHGTGTIHEQFIKAAAGQTGAAGVASTNPHNQTFAVGIQLGLVGIVVLWAMWLAHVLLFRAPGLVAWIGLVVVVQNIIGSLFNSHLFDFLQGWTYVVGVGVAGGMMLRARAGRSAA